MREKGSNWLTPDTDLSRGGRVWEAATQLLFCSNSYHTKEGLLSLN